MFVTLSQIRDPPPVFGTNRCEIFKVYANHLRMVWNVCKINLFVYLWKKLKHFDIFGPYNFQQCPISNIYLFSRWRLDSLNKFFYELPFPQFKNSFLILIYFMTKIVWIRSNPLLLIHLHGLWFGQIPPLWDPVPNTHIFFRWSLPFFNCLIMSIYI